MSEVYDSRADTLEHIGFVQGRFGYSNELRAILENTAEELGW